MFTQIAEGHQGCQQDAQRQGQRQQIERRMEKQFSDKIQAKTFTHQIIDISPQKLHDYDKLADAKCHQEPGQEPG